jgi:membrane protease subunit HflK
MYYETMESVLTGVNKTVIESQGVTSYLPLPQLQNPRTNPETAAAASGDGR